MTIPTVSFVVPCYKLAEFLSICVQSILSQTFDNFEILIMDDCSPDNTADVARSFSDERVRYVRNDTNLGALRNYNKGINMSQGKYIWLISADDYLRQPYVLQAYVRLLETHPRVGYAFCPGVGVRNGQETEVLKYSIYGKRNRIVKGHVFLRTLLSYNLVLAPSVLVRRECYEQFGSFPLSVTWAGRAIDLIWGGDWYLWCLFALSFDVGYFAEPMVCYREHLGSSTSYLTKEKIDSCAAADISVLWILLEKAKLLGYAGVSRDCLNAVAYEYARHCVSKEYRWLDKSYLSNYTVEQFEESLCRSTQIDSERRKIRARVYAAMADLRFWSGDTAGVKQLYIAGLQKDPTMIKVYAKIILLALGRGGYRFRRLLQLLHRG